MLPFQMERSFDVKFRWLYVNARVNIGTEHCVVDPNVNKWIKSHNAQNVNDLI